MRWQLCSVISTPLFHLDWLLLSSVMLCVVYLQEFAGEDTSDLFLEEREQALMKAQEEKKRKQLAVPGIVNPHDVAEEMQD